MLPKVFRTLHIIGGGRDERASTACVSRVALHLIAARQSEKCTRVVANKEQHPTRLGCLHLHGCFSFFAARTPADAVSLSNM